jgi:peptide/nickel transport system substrate-binding protein
MNADPTYAPRNALRRPALRMVAATTAALTVGAMLAGCSSSSSPSATASCSPKAGGALTIGMANSFDSMDPNANSIADSGFLSAIDLVNQPLARISDDGKTIEPVLATSSQHNADYTQWTFKLRPGVKFSDGKAFGADDVIFSLNHYKNGVWAGLFAGITSVKAPDPLTVQVNFKAPAAQFAAGISSAYSAAMLEDKYGGQKEADYFLKPVGTGPYTVESFQPGQSLTLKKNPTYWDMGKPYLDTITMQYTPDANTRVSGLRGGSFDMIDRIPVDSKDTIAKSAQYIDVNPAVALDGLFLNPATPVLKDDNFRKALAQSINREEIVTGAFGGEASPADGLIPSAVPGWAAPTVTVGYDLAAAKASIAASNKPSGGAIDVIYSQGDPATALEAQIIQAQWAKIGVKATVTGLPTAEFFDRVGKADFQVLLYQYKNMLPTIFDNVFTYVYFGGFFGWPTKTVEGYLATLNHSNDPTSVHGVATNYQNFVNTQIGQIPLVLSRLNTGLVNKVAGFAETPNGVWRLAGTYLCGK